MRVGYGLTKSSSNTWRRFRYAGPTCATTLEIVVSLTAGVIMALMVAGGGAAAERIVGIQQAAERIADERSAEERLADDRLIHVERLPDDIAPQSGIPGLLESRPDRSGSR
jgi:hypothetical protein